MGSLERPGQSANAVGTVKGQMVTVRCMRDVRGERITYQCHCLICLKFSLMHFILVSEEAPPNRMQRDSVWLRDREVIWAGVDKVVQREFKLNVSRELSNVT
jgi:hypothetical protein